MVRPPLSSSQWRVSCTTLSPACVSVHWRSASYSIARNSDRNEFRFLISARVPNADDPGGRTDTLASIRSDPSSIFTSDTPTASSVARSSST